MALINIFFPAIILIEILLAKRHLSRRIFFLLNIIIFLILAALSIPIKISGYSYSNWILEYLKTPFLFTSIALIIGGFLIDLKRSKTYLIIVFCSAFLINIMIQGLIFFGAAFGGGEYASKYNHHYDWKIDDFYISHFWKQGFAGPRFHQYVIDKIKLNGFIYKEIARTTENDTTKCEIKFYKNMGQNVYILDKCKMTIKYEKNK
jgi:hypothetical protein